MIHFNEQDPLKVVAMKIFKVMRPLLTQTAFITDPAFSLQSEVEAYQTVFSSSSPAPYEMVLIMKDGTRWKLDPNINQSKKMNIAVDFDQVARFECIFLP